MPALLWNAGMAAVGDLPPRRSTSRERKDWIVPARRNLVSIGQPMAQSRHSTNAALVSAAATVSRSYLPRAWLVVSIAILTRHSYAQEVVATLERETMVRRCAN